MKRSLKYLLALLPLMPLASCNDYLDIQPVGRVIPETLDDYRALMTSAYASFPDHKSLLTLRADEVMLDENSLDFANYRDIYLWQDLSPDAATTPYPWQQFYTSIFYANHIIHASNQVVTTDKAQLQQLQGEAYLLRAYAHFELLNMYAQPYEAATAATTMGVPIVEEINLEQTFVPATVAEVYGHVFADIEMAMPLLQVDAYKTGKNYRFSKVAAEALKARFYLYRQEWQHALEAAEKVLQTKNQLVDLNASNAMEPSRYDSPESIMALEDPLKPSVARSVYVSEALAGQYNQEGDLRFPLYFDKEGSALKSRKGNGPAYQVTFRTSEMYLIKAEALAQLKRLDEARSTLLHLTSHRLTPELFAQEVARIEGLGQEQMLQELLEERQRELALEGHRWYDLRRSGQPQVIKEVAGKTYTLERNDPRYTIRYPREAVLNNPDLSL